MPNMIWLHDGDRHYKIKKKSKSSANFEEQRLKILTSPKLNLKLIAFSN